MDWDDIRFFLAVARAGQFSAAAARMGVDESTIARRINSLEKSLEVRLFDRQRTGSVLTRAGERFLVTAEELESQLLKVQGELSGADVEMSGTVRIASPDGFGTLFLCPRIGALKARFPALTIQLVPMTRAFSLSKREADLAITIDRPSEGRLVARKLVDYQLIFMPEIYGPSFSRLECSTAVGQLEAVRSGAGIGVLHDYAAQRDRQLQMVLPGIRFDRTYWIVTHADVHGLARVRAAMDYVIQQVNENKGLFKRD